MKFTRRLEQTTAGALRSPKSGPARPAQAASLPHKRLAVLAIGGALLLHGELRTWIQHIPAGPVIAALFRSVPMPGGAVPILLPPAESRWRSPN